MSFRTNAVALLTLVLLAGCAGHAPRAEREPDETAAEPTLAASKIAHATVAEAFLTPATPQDNVDSPAAWVAPDGRTLLIATAKKSSRLMIYDGDDGKAAMPFGSAGKDLGQFARPNGLFVVDDLLFVVERDNRRVQVIDLPGFTPLGTFGEAELTQPYGIWLHKTGERRYDVLVTDAYMAGQDARGEDILPPLAALDRRVRRYAVSVAGSRVEATLTASIGDTTAAGAIRVPESVAGDPEHGRLLIAEEDQKTGTAIRDYGLDGRYRSETIGLGLFRAQAEGIALFACGGGSGYWIATDQFKDRSLFHVFDRASLKHLGAFSGNTVGNTDGVWLHQGATKRFPSGVFYAVHDDQAVGAFDWRDIAAALRLRADCAR